MSARPEESSAEPCHAGSPILVFSLQNWENTFLSCKPCSLWCFEETNATGFTPFTSLSERWVRNENWDLPCGALKKQRHKHSAGRVEDCRNRDTSDAGQNLKPLRNSFQGKLEGKANVEHTHSPPTPTATVRMWLLPLQAGFLSSYLTKKKSLYDPTTTPSFVPLHHTQYWTSSFSSKAGTCVMSVELDLTPTNWAIWAIFWSCRSLFYHHKSLVWDINKNKCSCQVGGVALCSLGAAESGTSLKPTSCALPWAHHTG